MGLPGASLEAGSPRAPPRTTGQPRTPPFAAKKPSTPPCRVHRKHLTPAGEQGTPSRSGANGHTTRGWAAESAAPAGSPGSPRTAGQPGTPPRSETTGNMHPPLRGWAAGNAVPAGSPGALLHPPPAGRTPRDWVAGRTHPKLNYRESAALALHKPAGGCLRLTRGVHRERPFAQLSHQHRAPPRVAPTIEACGSLAGFTESAPSRS